MEAATAEVPEEQKVAEGCLGGTAADLVAAEAAADAVAVAPPVEEVSWGLVATPVAVAAAWAAEAAREGEAGRNPRLCTLAASDDVWRSIQIGNLAAVGVVGSCHRR